MKIRKIIAPTMPEAMSRVKKEIGSDAVILHTKNVKKKAFFGFINKSAVEVVVAIEQDTAPSQQRVTMSQPKATTPVQAEKRPKPQVAVGNNLQQTSTNKVKQEWGGAGPQSIQQTCDRLIDEGVGKEHVDSIGQALLKKWYSAESPLTKEEVKNALNDVLLNKLSSHDFQGLTYKQRVLNLVGPTGVGKTTTAAKLASKAALDDGKSVAFITTDTYRIAAVDQLKTYAKILNLPVEVAYSTEDFKKALDKHKDKDLIIVDSAGRNYQQSKFVHELKTLIPFSAGMETHLVLSATAKPSDLTYITRQFHEIPINKFIFTKVDETKCMGSLLHLLLNHRIGVSYFTNGQNVPDDLIEGDKKAFVYHLIEGVYRG